MCLRCQARVQTSCCGSAAWRASPCSECSDKTNAAGAAFNLSSKHQRFYFFYSVKSFLQRLTSCFHSDYRTDKKFTFTASPSQPQVNSLIPVFRVFSHKYTQWTAWPWVWRVCREEVGEQEAVTGWIEQFLQFLRIDKSLLSPPQAKGEP